MACTDVDRWMGHPVGSTRLEVSVVHWQRCLHWMWILCFASPCLAWVIVQFVANGGIYWKKIDGDSIRMANCGQTNNREICSIVVPCCCALAGEEQSDDSSSSSSSSGTAAAALGTAVQRSPSTIPTIPNSRPPDYFVPLERGGAAGPNGARSARPRSPGPNLRSGAGPTHTVYGNFVNMYIYMYAACNYTCTHSIEGDARETAQCPDWRDCNHVASKIPDVRLPR
jgi:hypothetical protein